MNITCLLVFHNFFRLKNNFEKVFPTTLVRMTEHGQHFEMFLDSAVCGPRLRELKIGGRLNGLCALIASSLLWMIFFDVCSVLILLLSFLLSTSHSPTPKLNTPADPPERYILLSLFWLHL